MFLSNLFHEIALGSVLTADTFYYTEKAPIEGEVIDVNDKNHALVDQEGNIVIVDLNDKKILHDLGDAESASPALYFSSDSFLSNSDHILTQVESKDGEERYESYYVWSPRRGWKKIFEIPTSEGYMTIYSMNNAGDVLLGSRPWNMIDQKGISHKYRTSHYFWDRNKEELVKLSPELKDDVYQFYYLADKTWIPVLGYKGNSLRILELEKESVPFSRGTLMGVTINSKGDLFGAVDEQEVGPAGRDKNFLFLRTGTKTLFAKRWDLKNNDSEKELSREKWNNMIRHASYSMMGPQIVELKFVGVPGKTLYLFPVEGEKDVDDMDE